MEVHEKIKRLQEALDELKREIGYSSSDESSVESAVDELGEEINLSEFTEEESQGHFETHRF